jgi:hypothetical protein
MLALGDKVMSLETAVVMTLNTDCAFVVAAVVVVGSFGYSYSS